MRLRIVVWSVTAMGVVTSCGGVFDDGWSGLSEGGDVRLLHEAGAACIGADASAATTPPECSNVGEEDPACAAWLQSMWPVGAPFIAGCSGPVPLMDGGQHNVCTLKYAPPPCNYGPAGDKYCTAWFAQFYDGISIEGVRK